MSTKPSPPTSSAPIFNLGDIVRRKFDPDEAGMIVGITYRFNNLIEYAVSWPNEVEEHSHYGQELRDDETFVEKAG